MQPDSFEIVGARLDYCELRHQCERGSRSRYFHRCFFGSPSCMCGSMKIILPPRTSRNIQVMSRLYGHFVIASYNDCISLRKHLMNNCIFTGPEPPRVMYTSHAYPIVEVIVPVLRTTYLSSDK